MAGFRSVIWPDFVRLFGWISFGYLAGFRSVIWPDYTEIPFRIFHKDKKRMPNGHREGQVIEYQQKEAPSFQPVCRERGHINVFIHKELNSTGDALQIPYLLKVGKGGGISLRVISCRSSSRQP